MRAEYPNQLDYSGVVKIFFKTIIRYEITLCPGRPWQIAGSHVHGFRHDSRILPDEDGPERIDREYLLCDSNASAGNRTRVTSMATMYSTTRPLMLLDVNHLLTVSHLDIADRRIQIFRQRFFPQKRFFSVLRFAGAP